MTTKTSMGSFGPATGKARLQLSILLVELQRKPMINGAGFDTGANPAAAGSLSLKIE